MKYPTARRLLAEELTALLREHYADGMSTPCKECKLAYRVRRELESLARHDGLVKR